MGARPPPAQLRPRRADRGCYSHPGAGRAQALRAPASRNRSPGAGRPSAGIPPAAQAEPWPAPPASQTLMMRAAERGANLGAITVGLLRLLERYGAAALQDAILEALVRDVPHPNAVRLALERQREQIGGEPPVAIVMPAHVRNRDAPVRPHALETYDQLKDQHDEPRSND